MKEVCPERETRIEKDPRISVVAEGNSESRGREILGRSIYQYIFLENLRKTPGTFFVKSSPFLVLASSILVYLFILFISCLSQGRHSLLTLVLIIATPQELITKEH